MMNTQIIPNIILKYLNWVDNCYINNTNFRNLLFFRGQADEKWRLLPSVMRLAPELKIAEKQLILDYKQVEIEEMDYRGKMENMLVTMQHYGIPTRLLDFSMSPLVALYFACSSNMKRNAKIYMLNPWKAYAIILMNTPVHPCKMDIFKEARMGLAQGYKFEEIDKQIFSRYQYHIVPNDLTMPIPFVGRYMVSRITTQKGAFVIWGDERKNGLLGGKYMSLDEYPEYEDCMDSFIVPSKDKKKCLEWLSRMDINSYSIFQDLNGMANSIHTQGGIFRTLQCNKK